MQSAPRTSTCAAPNNSVKVFPILLLQEIGKDRKNRQEYEDVNSNTVAYQLSRLTQVNQEIGQVAHILIELLRRFRSRLGEIEALEFAPLENLLDHLPVLLYPLLRFNGSEYRPLFALPLIQCVRHRNIAEHDVVPARRRLLVAIEPAQVGIHPTWITPARHQRQVRRRRAKPNSGVFLAYRRLHQIADLIGREQKIFLHQFFRNPKIRAHAVVAHVGGAMARQTVIDEYARPALQ